MWPAEDCSGSKKLMPLKKTIKNFHFHKTVIDKELSEYLKHALKRQKFNPEPNLSLAHSSNSHPDNRIGLERATNSEYTEIISRDLYSKLPYNVHFQQFRGQARAFLTVLKILGFNSIYKQGLCSVGAV